MLVGLSRRLIKSVLPSDIHLQLATMKTPTYSKPLLV
jgi:hypothetical protein